MSFSVKLVTLQRGKAGKINKNNEMVERKFWKFSGHIYYPYISVILANDGDYAALTHEEIFGSCSSKKIYNWQQS